MTVNELEKALLMSLLTGEKTVAIRDGINFERVEVTEREFTGVGFFTTFARSEELRLFEPSHVSPWGEIRARINKPPIETGYLFEIKQGVVVMIEGYLNDKPPWPEKIECFELYYGDD